MRRRRGYLLAAFGLLALGGVPLAFLACADDDPSKLLGEHPPVDAAVESGPDTYVPPIDSFNPCEHIPSFGARSQTIDGNGQDFDGLPTVYFIPTLGSVYKDDPDAGPPSGSLEGKIAWSPLGLHLFFHVKDSTVVVPAEADAAPAIYPDGDGLELFLGGTSLRTGIAAHDGKDPTAYHLILVPPAKNATTYPTGRITRWMNLPYDYPFLGKLVDDGYTLELQVPWLALRPNPPVVDLVPKKGDRIAFTFALQHADDPTTGHRQSLSVFAVNADAVAGNACMTTPATCPDVDDRSWCQPVLE